jgi:hypothetical protein
VVLCRFGGSRAGKTLALLGLTSGSGASWFGAAPARLLSPLACSLHIYLAVYYLCCLQMPRSLSCLLRQRTDILAFSLLLLFYKTLEVGRVSDLLPMVPVRL